MIDRDAAEDEAGEDGDGGAEGEHGAIHSNGGAAREIAGADEGEEADAGGAGNHSAESADDGERHGLDEQLQGEAGASGAEAVTDGELFHANAGADEHEVGDIDATDQGHEADGALEEHRAWGEYRRRARP